MERNNEYLDNHSDKIRDISKRLLIKTDKISTDKLIEDLKRYALYNDLRDLYNKTVIPMSKF